jgi:hypothetical protein
MFGLNLTVAVVEFTVFISAKEASFSSFLAISFPVRRGGDLTNLRALLSLI